MSSTSERQPLLIAASLPVEAVGLREEQTDVVASRKLLSSLITDSIPGTCASLAQESC